MDTDQPRIWGIAGGSGSGKTTLTSQLVERLGPEQVVVIHHDAYYRNRPDLTFEQRCAVNYDHPDSLETDLLVDHLEQLRRGVSAPVPEYDYTRHLRCADLQLVEPRPLVLVEGILVFADERLRTTFDLCVFVDVPADVRLARRIERDVRDRGRDPEDVRATFRDVVGPMHDRFVEPHKLDADLVITHPDDREAWIEGLVEAARGGVGAPVPTVD